MVSMFWMVSVRGRRMVPMFSAVYGNDLLDDVYELSILEYLLDVHLGADVLLGVLVAVVVARGGGGLHNHSGNNSNSNDKQGLHVVGGR